MVRYFMQHYMPGTEPTYSVDDATHMPDATASFAGMSLGDRSAPGPDLKVPSPLIVSIQEGETVYQRVLLIYGRAGPPHTHFEGQITVYPQNFPMQRWPVVDTHFKCLVPLEPGQNLVRFQCNGAETLLTLHYLPRLQNPPLRLAIMVAKDSPLTFDAPPDKQGPGKNDLSAAIKRLRCAAYMWQAFNAEQMYRNGFGRRTFRLDEAWLPETLTDQEDVQRNTAQVYIVRSRLTTAEMRDPLHAQQYQPQTGETSKDSMFTLFSHALEDYGAPFDRDCYVAGMTLDSHWDSHLRVILAHAALGGGGGSRRQCVFGSHLTYAWPSCLEEIVPKFLDTTPVDERFTANDANECGEGWKAANVGMGAFLHEVGHLLTLGHTQDGIMSRGFNNYNRTFMVKEPRFQPITPEDEAGSHWTRVDMIRLRYHPCLRLPTDALALPARNAVTDSTLYAVEEGILVKNPVGISMVEIWINDRLKGHLEYVDGDHHAATPALPPRPGSATAQPVVTPTQLTLTRQMIFNKAPWQAGDRVTLDVVSVAQNSSQIPDFERFLGEHRVTIPHYEHLHVYKSNQLGNGTMNGTVPFQAYFSSGHGNGAEFMRGPGGFAPLAHGGRALPPLTHLRIYHGLYVDGFVAYLADGSWVQCGKVGPNPVEFPLAPGEGLSQINVNSGAWIDSLEFITTHGRTTGWCGSSRGGTVHVLKVPTGYQWAGIYGSGAGWLDSIGCFYTKA
ncbi:hypothetical protein IWQ60_004667 [Tieghemiomyces parasiticus]|uniref:Jacalin-type lectin domain-containing protein n=1 Tax=Tieghemiomyces parasiticus TaxID=78921 RepID=A0A9W8AFW6_9FUNG|nr:hypothetical protein IWQ60_004667 [Tieghemiomyces parasiticus]